MDKSIREHVYMAPAETVPAQDGQARRDGRFAFARVLGRHFAIAVAITFGGAVGSVAVEALSKFA